MDKNTYNIVVSIGLQDLLEGINLAICIVDAIWADEDIWDNFIEDVKSKDGSAAAEYLENLADNIEIADCFNVDIKNAKLMNSNENLDSVNILLPFTLFGVPTGSTK